MTDSCSPSKLEPGLAVMNSIPSSFSVCTMRSEPGRRSRVAGNAPGETLPASRRRLAGLGGGTCVPPGPAGPPGPSGEAAGPAASRACGAGPGITAVAAAAAPVAALFKKSRRPGARGPSFSDICKAPTDCATLAREETRAIIRGLSSLQAPVRCPRSLGPLAVQCLAGAPGTDLAPRSASCLPGSPDMKPLFAVVVASIPVVAWTAGSSPDEQFFED